MQPCSNPPRRPLQLTKVTRRVTKEIRMPKTVSQRRSWKKFGEANGGRGGPQGQMEQGITMKTAEEVVLTLKHDALLGHDKREEMMNKQHKSADSIVVCRNCGRVGDHWTLKCPYAKMDGDGALGDEAVGEPGAGGAYVAPARKKGAGEALTAGDSMRGGDRDFATLRVSNLSEETQEADLDALFRPFGPVARIYLAKDKYTNLSRGFGFINYHRREDAQRAMDKLNGYGFDNLILSVQFAEPREDRPDDRPREGRGMQAHSERY